MPRFGRKIENDSCLHSRQNFTLVSYGHDEPHDLDCGHSCMGFGSVSLCKRPARQSSNSCVVFFHISACRLCVGADAQVAVA